MAHLECVRPPAPPSAGSQQTLPEQSYIFHTSQFLPPPSRPSSQKLRVDASSRPPAHRRPRPAPPVPPTSPPGVRTQWPSLGPSLPRSLRAGPAHPAPSLRPAEVRGTLDQPPCPRRNLSAERVPRIAQLCEETRLLQTQCGSDRSTMAPGEAGQRKTTFPTSPRVGLGARNPGCGFACFLPFCE